MPIEPKVSTTQLGRYPVEAELGRGAMGVVYRSTHPRLEIPVAIKVLAEQYSTDASFRQRFHRAEAPCLLHCAHSVAFRSYSAGSVDLSSLSTAETSPLALHRWKPARSPG